MNKTLLTVTLLFLFGVSTAQDYFSNPDNRHSNHLIIVHPTRTNLERYRFLIENKIFNPGKNKLVGLYFKGEAYDYTGLAKDFPEFGFEETDYPVEENRVFSENACSEEFKMIFEYSKGIIFNGGPDIPPSLFNESTSLLTVITDPSRHTGEISFLVHLLGSSRNPGMEPLLRAKPKYLILGICLGMQSMNVACGGSLVQDIPSELYAIHSVEQVLNLPAEQQHRNYRSTIEPNLPHLPGSLHPIEILPGRRLAEFIPERQRYYPVVVSAHHQSVDLIAEGFRAAALSMDGHIVEALEHMKYPNVIGIQFHPEISSIYPPDKTPADSLSYNVEPEAIKFHFTFWKEIGSVLR
jgi:putative glutamine amidotransferase